MSRRWLLFVSGGKWLVIKISKDSGVKYDIHKKKGNRFSKLKWKVEIKLYLGSGLCLMLGRDCLFFSTFSLVRALFSFSFSRSLSFFSFLFLSICMMKGWKKKLSKFQYLKITFKNKTRYAIHSIQENRGADQGPCFALLAVGQSNNITINFSVRFRWTHSQKYKSVFMIWLAQL